METETILEIKETSRTGFDGFEVITDQQTISLLISNSRDCCESWGFFMSEDNLSSFVGATLFSVAVTDDALQTVQVPFVYEGGVMFVNLHTNKGTLQFVAYNSHNGYYGHEARVECKQVSRRETL